MSFYSDFFVTVKYLHPYIYDLSFYFGMNSNWCHSKRIKSGIKSRLSRVRTALLTILIEAFLETLGKIFNRLHVTWLIFDSRIFNFHLTIFCVEIYEGRTDLLIFIQLFHQGCIKILVLANNLINFFTNLGRYFSFALSQPLSEQANYILDQVLCITFLPFTRIRVVISASERMLPNPRLWLGIRIDWRLFFSF